MGFFKDLFFGNPLKPWREIDPAGKFKDKLIDILGMWEFSKLDSLMQMYKVFEVDLFRSGEFAEYPDDLKLEPFVIIINNWANFLVKNGQLRDAETVLRASIKLQTEPNPAHLSLVGILLQTERLKEASEEAKAALKTIDRLRTQSQNLDISIPDKYQLGDTTELQQWLYEIIKASEENENIGRG